MKKLILLLALGSLAGCVSSNNVERMTEHGVYSVTEIDSTGQELENARGGILRGRRGVYAITTLICTLNPKAIVRITNFETGKEIKSESPYKCK